MSVKQKTICKVPLNMSSAVFFTQLIQNGMASFKEDKSLKSDEAYAVLKKHEDKTSIHIVANNSFILTLAAE